MDDTEFITKTLSIPLSKRARVPTNQKKIQSVGKGFMSLINDMNTNKIDRQLTGYVSFLDEQTHSLVLKITTLKKYDELLTSFLNRAILSRSAGGSGFNEYGRKHASVQDTETEFSTFDLSQMEERKKAALRYNLLSKTGIVSDEDSITLPSAVPITRRVKNEVRRGSISTSALQKQYDYVTWKNALDRDRRSRAIFEGVDENSLLYQLPEDNKYGITQEFVDAQNKQLERLEQEKIKNPIDFVVWKNALERDRKNRALEEGVDKNSLLYQLPEDNKYGITQEFVDAQNEQLENDKVKNVGVGTVKGYLLLLLASLSSILGVAKKILNYSKQGAEAAQERTVSAKEFALSKEEMDVVLKRETELGTGGKGVIQNIFKELVSNFNSATSLNEKELEKLALLGNASGQGELIQRALDMALSGGGVVDLFNAIESAVDAVVSNGIDVVTGNYIGGDEAQRQVASFLGGAWVPYLTKSWAVDESMSANNRTGTGAEVTALTQKVAQAYDVSRSNLEKLIEDLTVRLAAWVQRFGVIDKIYDLLLRLFSDPIDKEQQKQFARDQNEANAASLRATASILENTAVAKEVQTITSKESMRETLNTKLSTPVTLAGGIKYTPTIKELLELNSSQSTMAFQRLSTNQWKEFSSILGKTEEGKQLLEILPTYFLLERTAQRLKSDSLYDKKATSVTVNTAEMSLQAVESIIRSNNSRDMSNLLGNLDEAVSKGYFGDINVYGGDEAQRNAAVTDMFATGIANISSWAVAPEKASVLNLENNVNIKMDDGTEKTYTILSTIDASKKRLENTTNINGYNTSTYGGSSSPVLQD